MSDALSSSAFIVMPSEAEQLIEYLREQPVDAIGLTKDWMSYHHTIEKLNLQAHQSAQRKQDNFVVEALVTYQKFPTLFVNLLNAEMWKANVFPLLKCQDEDSTSLRLYFIIYHEAAIVNLLEVAFYHEHVIETMDDDMMIEIVDYCMRKLTWLIGLPRDAIANATTFHKSGQEIVNMIETQTPKSELQRQQMEIEFRIAVQCVTIVRYISERLHMLPLGIVSRLLDKHDVLLSLAALIENPPWTYKDVSKDEKTNEQVVRWKKFSQQKWSVVEPSDLLVLTATEAQVWLAVYYLICTKNAREHYEITQFRKEQLMRMRKYLNELLIDQLPLLADIQRYLDELSIMAVQSNIVGAKSTLVMETVPYVRDGLVRKFRKEFRAIAQRFDENSKEILRSEDIKQLAELYQMEGIDELLDESEERRKEREELQKAMAVDSKEEEEDIPPTPTRVVLVFNNRAGDPKAPKKPLIVEINDEDDAKPNTIDAEMPDEVQVICNVDLDTQKLMETKSHRYLRFTIRPQLSHSKRAQLIAWNSSAKATVVFEGDQDLVELHCTKLDLPQQRPQSEQLKREKLWKQIGSLQEDSRVVVQCQFITAADSFQPVDNQASHDQVATPNRFVPYELGSISLSIPF